MPVGLGVNWYLANKLVFNCEMKSLQLKHILLIILNTVEPRFNEPLYNEVLGITNDFLYPSDNKRYGKVPQYNET